MKLDLDKARREKGTMPVAHIHERIPGLEEDQADGDILDLSIVDNDWLFELYEFACERGWEEELWSEAGREAKFMPHTHVIVD